MSKNGFQRFEKAGQCQLSVVIPCHNESDVLLELRPRLVLALEKIRQDWEVIFVDDGSTDITYKVLQMFHAAEARFKIISLSRNFGQQAAIAAGLSHTSGDVVAVLDADLQDPPELLNECLAKIAEGYDVVYGVRRLRKESMLYRVACAAFYRLLKITSKDEIPLDAGDFCFMTKQVVEVLRRLPEQNMFLRGLRAWTGFRQVGLEYERGSRGAGKSSYSLFKLVKLALDGVIGFSVMPLRFATFLGIAVLLISSCMGIFTFTWWLLGFRFMGHTALELPGWTTLACGMFFFGAVQLLVLGTMGEYIGRIYTEVKQRPRWVIRETCGLGTPAGIRESSIRRAEGIQRE